MNLNYLLYRAKYKYGKHLPLTKPVDISLELASSCSMNCSYCYHADQQSLPFKKGLMRVYTAENIIYQAAELGVHSLKFNWRGESTLNPKYTHITTLAKSLKSGSTFIDLLANSNFKIPVKHREDKFKGLSNLTKVKISYDSFIKDVFEAQRTGGDHDLTTENINLFYNHPYRIKSETAIVIQAVRTNLNKNEDLIGECKKRWPEAEISIRDMVAGRVDNDAVTNLENKKRDFDNRQSCIQAHVRVIFDYEGNAYPCCPDIKNELYMGNINKNTLNEIFNSKYIKSLRKTLKSGDAFELDPCRNCPSHESYKGYKHGWNS